MLGNRKRMARLVVILFSALALVAGITTGWLNKQMQPPYWLTGHMEPIKAYIKQHGITPEVNQQLAGLPNPKNWAATFITERQGENFDAETDRIVAANPPELVGMTQRQFYDQYQGPQPGPSGWGENIEDPARGKSYLLWTMYNRKTFWAQLWATVAWIAVGIAWLGLTAWLWFDARERGVPAVAGWVLLGLLTGPIALAVWFISRPTRASEPEPEVCPGCGADTPPDAAYCVRCGYGLKSTCPTCRKVVEPDWTYCPACRTNLAEE